MSTRKKGRAVGDAAHAAHSKDNPAPEAGMSRDVFNIPDNVIQDGITGYTEQDQDDLMWMVGYTRKELNGSRSAICDMLVVDWTTITRILSGKYPASIAPFMEKVRDLQRRYNDSVHTGHVDTCVSRKIHNVLDYALAGDLDGGRIVMISGPARRGKTNSVKDWCRQNNHGRSVYIDAPESGGLRGFLAEIAGQTGVHDGRKTIDMRDRIIKSFNRRRILIIDEVMRLIPKRWGVYPTELEFIRRLHDTRGCAIALVVTPVAEREMEQGTLHVYFEQLLGRIAEPLHIPDRVMKREVRDIVCAFNSNPAEKLVDLAHEIANEKGRLGVLFEDLRKATAFAREKRTQLAAVHLQTVHKLRKGRFQWEDDK